MLTRALRRKFKVRAYCKIHMRRLYIQYTCIAVHCVCVCIMCEWLVEHMLHLMILCERFLYTYTYIIWVHNLAIGRATQQSVRVQTHYVY